MSPDRDAFLTDLAALVGCESPTDDLDACSRALDLYLGQVATGAGRNAEIVTAGGRPHALLRPSGAMKVLLLGHVDTVWPTGTLARWPFAVDGDTATGPGIFDMKAGLVMAAHALAELGPDSGVGLLVNTDEETGSLTSQGLVEDVARGCDAVLVLEPGAPGGAVKYARKGVSLFRARIVGRAAHAGLEPHKGVNALVEMSAQVPAVMALADESLGTTVTPTMATAGTTMNTVPAEATFRIDVRASTAAEQRRVDEGLQALRPHLDGSSLIVEHLGTRAPLEPKSSRSLLALHDLVAADLGRNLPPAVAVGGGSDGNFTAGVGAPTLDGLGAHGDGAHAEGEHIEVSGTLAALEVLIALLRRLATTPAAALR